MVDCVLVKPPVVEYSPKFKKLSRYQYGFVPPLGLLYIAAVLEENDIDVCVIDAEVENLSLEECSRKIEKISPSLVGVTAMSTFVSTSAKLLSYVKEIDSDILTFMGGPHPTVLPERTLTEYENVDVVVRGEGEYTVNELCKSYLNSNDDLSNIKGISFRQGNEMINTPARPFIEDLDTLPFPARHMTPVDRYRINTIYGEKGITTTLSTSRGCPYTCAYCGQPFGRKMRFRSPESIISEIKQLRLLGINHILFIDDTMTLNKKRMNKLLDYMIKEEFNIRWACTTRVDCVDKDLLVKMKKAGCIKVDFGIESGNQRILDLIRKGITLDQARNAVDITKSVGLDVVTYFMLGHPGETKDTIEDTIRFACELNPDVAQFAVHVPLPGTETWKFAKNGEYGMELLTDSVDNVGKYGETAVIRVNDLSEYDLPRYQNLAFKRFYLRPGYILNRLMRLNNLIKLINTIKAGLIYTLDLKAR